MGLESLDARDSPEVVGETPEPVPVGVELVGSELVELDSACTSGQPVVSKLSLFQPNVPG